jgi:light-regulated signal transduction histidine kinase (bacteriophytochrome)
LPSFHKDPHPEKSNLILLLGNLGLILSLIYVYLYYINAKAKKLINLNRKLKKSKINLKEQSRDHFLFSEASNHFLKSPIYIFNAFIDKIENGINENKTYDELKPYFSVIKHSIEEEEKFINNMFDYNKIILTTAQKKETEIISLLKKILDNFKQNHSHFQYNILENKDQVFIKTDEILFEKIILIITENAYLYNNNAIKKIEVTVEEAEKNITITFKDNGIGINTAFREKIFKPYVRLNTLENIPGTGIGLLKARKASNLINAQINLVNSSNNGSIFKLSINKYTNEENLNRFHRR